MEKTRPDIIEALGKAHEAGLQGNEAMDAATARVLGVPVKSLGLFLDGRVALCSDDPHALARYGDQVRRE